MATLNTILSVAESVGINDQRFIGQVVSRNQRISTSEILTVQPFGFDIKPMAYLLYSQNRPLLSALREADKATEQYLNFGSTGWVNYIAYQGGLSEAQIGSCQWQTSSANKTLVLGALPSVSSGTYIVRTGDFCQVGRYAYIATADVLIATLTSPVNAVIGQYGTTIALGGGTFTGTTFCVILREYPTYTLVPMTNDSFIAWNGNFKAFEAVL